MAISFYKLKVSEIKRETSQAVTVTFDIDSGLKDTFKFKHGQYLTLRFFIDGKDERRSYSICSSPMIEEYPSVTVKEVKGGLVSTYINNNLKVGDEVDVMPPLGSFTFDLNPNSNKNYVLFGGGSGITPLYSIMRSVLKAEPNSKVNLFYVNKNEESIIYKDSFDNLLKEYPNRLNIIHSLTNPAYDYVGEKGRINKLKAHQLVNKYLPNEILNSEYYLCGPVGMTDEVISALLEMNVPKAQIHKESFTKSEKQTTEIEDSSTEKVKIDEITVILYGESHKIKIEPDETVLIAGMRASLDPPFSCQIGACSTCRAKLKSGKVRMEDADALTDSEIAQGYILTCSSHPLTNDVVVDYDD